MIVKKKENRMYKNEWWKGKMQRKDKKGTKIERTKKIMDKME